MIIFSIMITNIVFIMLQMYFHLIREQNRIAMADSAKYRPFLLKKILDWKKDKFEKGYLCCL